VRQSMHSAKRKSDLSKNPVRPVSSQAHFPTVVNLALVVVTPSPIVGISGCRTLYVGLVRLFR